MEKVIFKDYFVFGMIIVLWYFDVIIIWNYEGKMFLECFFRYFVRKLLKGKIMLVKWF